MVVEPVPGGRLHQLEILLVLRGGAGGDLVEKSPVWRGSVPPNFANVPKKWSCPVTPSEGTKPRMEKELTRCVVEALVLGDVGGGNVARFAHRLGPAPGLDRLRFGERLAACVHAETVFAPTRMKVSAYTAPSK